MILHEIKGHQVWSINPVNGIKGGNFEIFEIKYFKAGKGNRSDGFKQQRFILLCFMYIE